MQRNKKLLLPIAIVIMGMTVVIAKAWGPQMMLSQGLTSAPTPPPSGPSPPSQAAAAGFTTLLANFDWSNNSLCATTTGASSQTCVAASPASNWLDCSGSTSSGTDTSKLLHYSSNGNSGGISCSNIGVAIDPATGKQGMYMQMPAGTGTATSLGAGNGPNLVVQTASYGASGINNAGFTTAPQGWYIEAQEHLDWTQSNNSGSSTNGLFLYQNDTPCVLDMEVGELYPDTSPNGAEDGGAINWCPQTGQGYFQKTWGGVIDFPISGYQVTQVHIYAGLRTTNGSNSVFSCNYIDNVLMVQGSQNNGCINQYPSGQTVHAARTFLISGVVNNSVVVVPANERLWTGWIRIWACAGGASGECNGSTLNPGGAPSNGSVAYWH